MGWDSTIGRWARVEGTPSDPNPNDPYAKIDSETLFRDGRLTPSITILGTSLLYGITLALLTEAASPPPAKPSAFSPQAAVSPFLLRLLFSTPLSFLTKS